MLGCVSGVIAGFSRLPSEMLAYEPAAFTSRPPHALPIDESRYTYIREKRREKPIECQKRQKLRATNEMSVRGEGKSCVWKFAWQELLHNAPAWLAENEQA